MSKMNVKIREIEAFLEKLVSRGKLEPEQMNQAVRALKKLKKAIETADNRLLRKAIDTLAKCFLNMG